MSTYENSLPPLEGFPKTVRLFPLPNLTLFPHVMQPLHVSEPRYLKLTDEALANDRLIAMATLASGWENDYEGCPPVCQTACLSRITSYHRLEDGSYNLLLAGVRRVRLLRELPSAKGFREADVEVLEDHYPAEDAAARLGLYRELRGALSRVLPGLPETDDQFEQLFGGEVSLGILTDLISYMLDVELEAKLALLAEVNVDRRAKLLLGHLSAAAADTAIGTRGRNVFPPPFSGN